MLSVDNGEVKLGKPLKKRFQHFCSPETDFPKSAFRSQHESSSLFQQVYSSYNLRAIHARPKKYFQSANLSNIVNPKTLLKAFYPVNFFIYEKLDTQKMINDSHRLYQVPLTASNKQIGEGEYSHNLIKPHLLDPVIKENFPTSLRLTSPEWKLAERKSGLRKALLNHLTIMKNHEPEMYDFCLDVARKLNAQRSIKDRPEVIIPICVHQDEIGYCRELLNSLMLQRGVNLKNIHIYFFVNGNDQEKIRNVATQLTYDAAKMCNLTPGDFPRISVIAAPINVWRFGLKSIPLNIAMMQLMLSEVLNKSDADIPVIFLDADLLHVPPILVKERIDAIKKGCLITGGGFGFPSLSKEASSHINFELLKHIKLILGKMDLNAVDLKRLGAKPKKVESSLVDEFNMPGANSCASLMALAYSGAIKPYSFCEEDEWQKPIIDLFTNVFKIKDIKKAFKHGLFSDSDEDVMTDGGEYLRILKQGLSVENLYLSHEGGEGNYTKVDFANKKLNVKRLQEDIDSCIDQKIEELRECFSIPKASRAKFIKILLQKFEIGLKIAGEYCPEYKSDFQQIKHLVSQSSKRYGTKKIRFGNISRAI